MQDSAKSAFVFISCMQISEFKSSSYLTFLLHILVNASAVHVIPYTFVFAPLQYVSPTFTIQSIPNHFLTEYPVSPWNTPYFKGNSIS